MEDLLGGDERVGMKRGFVRVLLQGFVVLALFLSGVYLTGMNVQATEINAETYYFNEAVPEIANQENYSNFSRLGLTEWDYGNKQFYVLDSLEDILWYRALVNGDMKESGEEGAKVKQDSSANAFLAADITIHERGKIFGEDGIVKTGIEVEAWTPIGKDSEKGFSGFFDGRGYCIRGMYIYSDDSDSQAAQGLFGCVQGTVANLAVEDSYVHVAGSNRAGVICGFCGPLTHGAGYMSRACSQIYYYMHTY